MTRLIDKLPTPAAAQIREKKVIVLARSRTGTLSLYNAFTILGYKTYHGAEVMRRGIVHLQLFEEAMAAKYFGIGEPFGRAEFDKWFAEYEVIVEIPAVLMEEMVAAYPEAKFLHLERDVDKWYRSVMSTVYHAIKATERRPLSYLQYTDPFIRQFCSFHRMVKRVWWHGLDLEHGEDVLKRDYMDLNRKARLLDIPADRFASFKLEDGFGWEQLCPFLAVPVPDVPYPAANTPERFDEMQFGFVKDAYRRVRIMAASVVIVPLVGLVWYRFLRT